MCLAGSGTDAGDSDGPPTDGMDPDDGRVRWMLIAHDGDEASNLDIVATQAGSTLLVGVETGNDTATGITDEKGNTYVRVSGSRAINPTEEFGVEVWIAQNVAADTKRVSATGPLIHGLAVWEVTGIASEDPIVGVTTLDSQGITGEPLGAKATTTAQGQFVLSIAIVQNFISGLTPDSALVFTNDETVFGNGWAHLTDPDAPAGEYTAQWNTPTPGTYCATSVVFAVR